MVAACQQKTTICKAKLADIAPAFNLIQDCSEAGCFNNAYLAPPYQTGVALQLFSVWLFGKIHLPSGKWHTANLRVIRHEGRFAGFILMRYLLPSGTSQEIYMCAIEAKYRGHGLGRQLVQSVLENLKCDSIIEAECLPKSIHMKHLLLRMGFNSTNHIKAGIHKNAAETFRISCAIKQDPISPG